MKYFMIFQKDIIKKENNENIKVIFFKKTKNPRFLKNLITGPLCFRKINTSYPQREEIRKMGFSSCIHGDIYISAEISKKKLIALLYDKALEKQRDLLITKYARAFDLNIGLKI